MLSVRAIVFFIVSLSLPVVSSSSVLLVNPSPMDEDKMDAHTISVKDTTTTRHCNGILYTKMLAKVHTFAFLYNSGPIVACTCCGITSKASPRHIMGKGMSQLEYKRGHHMNCSKRIEVISFMTLIDEDVVQQLDAIHRLRGSQKAYHLDQRIPETPPLTTKEQ